MQVTESQQKPAPWFDRFYQSIKEYPKTILFLSENNLLRYLLFPALLGLITGIVVIFSVWYALHSLLDLTNYQDYLPENFKGPTSVAAKIILIAPAMGLYMVFYRALISVLVLPFLGTLLDRIEETITGNVTHVSFGVDFVNALNALRTALIQTLVGLLVWLISIPLGPVQAILTAVTQGYFLGVGAFDTVYERHFKYKDRVALRGKNRPRILGVGIPMFLLLLIPVVGVLLAPVLGVATAAHMIYGQARK